MAKRPSFGFAYAEEVDKEIVFTAVMSQVTDSEDANENLFMISIWQSKLSKAKLTKRRRPKPLCLSNVHNIIMKLKNGIKIVN